MSIWEKILFKGQSKFNGEVKVTENSGVRRLVAGGHTQSQTLHPNGNASLRYWYGMVPEEIDLDADSRVLILGLGAGTTAKIITKRFGPIAIDGVEIDPLIVELGKKYFALDQPNLNIIIADASDFIKDARYKYDLICVDVFVAGSVPKEIENREFFEKVKNALADDGIVTVNKIFSGKSEQENFENLVRSVFSVTSSSVVRGDPKLDNVIVHARN
ncbi:MAG TPA: fused MFS/spermidine synthase [Candidatus Nanoarchaeia archaeon]